MQFEVVVTLRGRVETIPFLAPLSVGQLKLQLQPRLDQPVMISDRLGAVPVVLDGTHRSLLALNADGHELDDEALLEENLPVAGAGDHVPLKVHLLEVFSVTPVDLFRRVSFGQVFPLVLVDDPNVNAQLSSFVPLECAALSRGDTLVLPQWTRVNDDAPLSVRGASLTCIEAVQFERRDPLAPIDEADRLKCLQFCPLQDNDSVPRPDAAHDPNNFGFLHARPFWDEAGGGYMQDVLTERAKHGRVGRRERRGYFNFVLPAGTDLSTSGCAVVFDNSEPGHWSLVPRSFPFERARDIPAGHYDFSTSLCQRQAGIPADGADWRFVKPGQVLFMPVAASKFRLHSFVMEARADLECFADLGDEAPDPEQAAVLDALNMLAVASGAIHAADSGADTPACTLGNLLDFDLIAMPLQRVRFRVSSMTADQAVRVLEQLQMLDVSALLEPDQEQLRGLIRRLETRLTSSGQPPCGLVFFAGDSGPADRGEEARKKKKVESLSREQSNFLVQIFSIVGNGLVEIARHIRFVCSFIGILP